jgi:hypothetical protein
LKQISHTLILICIDSNHNVHVDHSTFINLFRSSCRLRESDSVCVRRSARGLAKVRRVVLGLFQYVLCGLDGHVFFCFN